MERRQRVSSGSPYEPVIGFCRAVRVGDVIAVSGTAPIGADGKTVAAGDPAAQTRRCLEIARDAIERLGGRLSDVIRTRMFLTHATDWEAVGRVHGDVFGEIRPASTIVVVKELLDPAWRIEIELDAIVGAAS